MRIVITGDTHVPQRSENIPESILEAISDADAVIHTGDFNSEDAYQVFVDRSEKLYAVLGNRDERPMEGLLPLDLSFELGGIRTTLLHGHSFGRPRPSRLARELGPKSDLIIYGHIHRPFIVRFRGCTLINPGSPTEPRGSGPSYVRGCISDGSLSAEIVHLP
ncbi:MAG: YfcE family phosphodiesterase [Bacillota bacterium]